MAPVTVKIKCRSNLSMYLWVLYRIYISVQDWIRSTRYERALWDGLSRCLRDLYLLSSMFSIQAFVSAAVAQTKIFESTIDPKACIINIGVLYSKHFVTSKCSYSGLIKWFLVPLISNICGELGSCCEIRRTSMAERGRMPCDETQMSVRVKLMPFNIW